MYNSEQVTSGFSVLNTDGGCLEADLKEYFTHDSALQTDRDRHSVFYVDVSK